MFSNFKESYYSVSMKRSLKDDLYQYVFDKKNIDVHDSCVKLLKECKDNAQSEVCGKCRNYVINYWEKAKYLGEEFKLSEQELNQLQIKHNLLKKCFTSDDKEMNERKGGYYDIRNFNPKK